MSSEGNANCIIKAFENNSISIIEESLESKKFYYFKASDVGAVLDIVNVRSSVINFDEDEKVVRAAYDQRGTKQDTLFLTSQGVYRLLYSSKKEVAKKFRKWVGNILDDIIFNESSELKKQLEQQKEHYQLELLKKSDELAKTQKQLEIKTKLKVKRWYDSEPGDTVYAVKNANNIKLGKTQSLRTRETAYVNDVFYARKCYNCDLAEKVIHHILDKFREENNKEYFDISEELAIYTIDMVCNFLDNFISYSEELPKSGMKENLETSLQTVQNLIKELKGTINTKVEIPTIDIPDNLYNDPNNFDRFIAEACEIHDDYFTSPYDLLGAFRLWCRGALCHGDIRHRLSVHFKSKFVFKDKFIPDYGSRFQVYLGVRPKVLKFEPENTLVLKKYEEFFIDECHVGYTFRIKYSDFLNAYKAWVKSNYPEHNVTKDELIEMKAYFNSKFLLTTIPGKKCIGLCGFQLKTDEAPKFGLQTRKHKVILRINVDTKEVTHRYESIIKASEDIKISTRSLWDYVAKKQVLQYDNQKFLLTYE